MKKSVSDLFDSTSLRTDTKQGSGFSIAYMRNWKDSRHLKDLAIGSALQALPRRPRRSPERLELAPVIAWSIRAFGRPFLLILDQFEEYFLYEALNKTRWFEDTLGPLLGRKDLPFHLLIGLRDDALHELNEFRSLLPSILDTTIKLDHLTDFGVNEAISGPIARYNEDYRKEGPKITVEPQLIATLIRQLREPGDGIGTGGSMAARGIELPYLQLALTKLWEAEGGIVATSLRAVTLGQQLGGVRKIVRDHVNKVMDTLSLDEQQLCSKTFDRLVTGVGSKIAYPTAALVNEEIVGQNINIGVIETALEKLTPKEARILKPVITNSLPGFEIFHDVLWPPILEWRRSFRQKADLARETQRYEQEKLAVKAKSLRRLASLAIISLVVTSNLAILGLWQWRVAQAERSRAESALALATETANELVFNLARIFKDASGVPASTIADILDRARKMQGQLAAGGSMSTDLERGQAAALMETVDSLLTTGDVKAALEAARQAHSFIEKLAQSDPRNSHWQRDLSDAYRKIGDVQQAQGNLSEALQAFSASRAIIEQLTASDPTNAGWQHDLSVTLNRIGNVQAPQGDLKAALQAYSDSLAIIRRLTASDPGNADWLRDLSASLNKVGDLRFAQGDVSAALQAYSDSLAIIKRLAASDPGNASWQRDLSVSLNRIGDVQAAQGDLKAALQAYSDSLAIVKRLTASDPGNASWQRDLSKVYRRIGDVQAAQGDVSAALQAYSGSLAIIKRLAASDPGNASWQSDLSESLNRIGDVQAAQGLRPWRSRAGAPWRRASQLLASIRIGSRRSLRRAVWLWRFDQAQPCRDRGAGENPSEGRRR